MVAISHAKTSAKSDGGDATLVQPSDWNAAHAVDWAVAGDLTAEAFGDTASAGTAIKVPRADHRHAMPATPTTVATDVIWDAAGDLAVGSGADTAARLAIGGAGGALSVINGAVAWNSGTSFPATPATGDRCWRRDLGMEFYYDGTRWLSTTLYHLSMSPGDTAQNTTTGGVFGRWAVAGASATTPDIWLVRADISLYTGSTNSGSHYWTMDVRKVDAAIGVTSLGTVSTAADSTSTAVAKTLAIGAVLDVSAYPMVDITTSKTGTPSALRMDATLVYRLIGV